MRRQLAETVESLMAGDPRVAVLLGDIGVWAFRRAFAEWPSRIFNIGVCEQSMVGLAAGMAMEGMMPIMHSIAPFVVERCYEQLKVDLCYQALNVNIISVGSSYDYSALGCTHQCPGDVAALLALPGMEIIVPGAPAEFDRLFRQAYSDGSPTYVRLSERSNQSSREVNLGEILLLHEGAAATVIAVGPVLDTVLEAVRGLDVGVAYCTSLRPCDHEFLVSLTTSKVVTVEPYYAGTLAFELRAAVGAKSLSIDSIGVPLRFLDHYGTATEHDRAIGMTAQQIRRRIEGFIDA